MKKVIVASVIAIIFSVAFSSNIKAQSSTKSGGTECEKFIVGYEKYATDYLAFAKIYIIFIYTKIGRFT